MVAPPTRKPISYTEELLQFIASNYGAGGEKVTLYDKNGVAIDSVTINGLNRLCIDTELDEVILDAGQVVVNIQDKQGQTAPVMDTTTPLPAANTFTSAWADMARFDTILLLCFAGHSVAKNANGTLVVEQSADGVNTDMASPINVTDAFTNTYNDAQGNPHPNGVAAKIKLLNRYVRVLYYNGANPQDTMRLSVWKQSIE